MYQSIYNMPCACALMRNGFNVPLSAAKGKGKRIHIYAALQQDKSNSGEYDFTKHPYLQVEPSSASESLFRCGLHQVQKVNQTLLADGKITIDIVEGASTLNPQATDISLRKSLVQQQLAHLCVTDSTPQTLKLFIAKLHEVIKTYSTMTQKMQQQQQQIKAQQSQQQQVSSENPAEIQSKQKQSQQVIEQKEKERSPVEKSGNSSNIESVGKSESSSRNNSANRSNQSQETRNEKAEGESAPIQAKETTLIRPVASGITASTTTSSAKKQSKLNFSVVKKVHAPQPVTLPTHSHEVEVAIPQNIPSTTIPTIAEVITPIEVQSHVNPLITMNGVGNEVTVVGNKLIPQQNEMEPKKQQQNKKDIEAVEEPIELPLHENRTIEESKQTINQSFESIQIQHLNLHEQSENVLQQIPPSKSSQNVETLDVKVVVEAPILESRKHVAFMEQEVHEIADSSDLLNQAMIAEDEHRQRAFEMDSDDEVRYKNKHLQLVSKSKRGDKRRGPSSVLISSDDEQYYIDAIDSLRKPQNTATVANNSLTSTPSEKITQRSIHLSQQSVGSSSDSVSKLPCDEPTLDANGHNNNQGKRKYFLGVDRNMDIEGQYQREQMMAAENPSGKRAITTAGQQSVVTGSSGMTSEKFSLFQEKIQEIKNKQMSKTNHEQPISLTYKQQLQSLQQQQQQQLSTHQSSSKQNLYKVNRASMGGSCSSSNITPLERHLAQKRSNPFKCEDEEEEEAENRGRTALGLTQIPNQTLITQQKARPLIADSSATPSNINNRQENVSRLQYVNNPSEAIINGQSGIKKLGSKFVFEKNSFAVKKQEQKQPVQQQQPITAGKTNNSIEKGIVIGGSNILPPIQLTKSSQVRGQNGNGNTAAHEGSKSKQLSCSSSSNMSQQRMGEVLLELPEHVMGTIMMFISKKEQFGLRVVCKAFNDAVFFCVRSLVFRASETPVERVIAMLNRAKQMRILQFGALKYVSPSELVSKWNIPVTAVHLETLNVMRYREMNDKLLNLLTKHAKNLQDISLAFSAKIQPDTLLRLPGSLSELKRFAMKSSADNFNFHEKITDDTFADFVAARHLKYLQAFEVFTVSPVFFEAILAYTKRRMGWKLKVKHTGLEQSGQVGSEEQQDDIEEVINVATNEEEEYEEVDEVGELDYAEEFKSNCAINIGRQKQQKLVSAFSRIQVLKFRNLVLTRVMSSQDQLQQIAQTASDKVFSVLKRFKNLKILKIVNVVRKAKGEWFLPFTPSNSSIESLFVNWKNSLQQLCLGNWATNETLRAIAESLDGLVKIRIIGNAVDDSGLEFVLQKMEYLREVNISQATRVNGHCFETVISRRLAVVKVSFDDFRLNCLKSTLEHHLQLTNTLIVNYKN